MKKRNLLCLLLIAACLAVFYGYNALQRLSTDTKAPEITVSPQALQVSVLDPRSALLQGVTAADNADGDVTSSLVVESVRLTDPAGTVNVTYAAFDKAGNVTRAQREIQYTDYESPKFSLSAPLAYTQNSGTDVITLIHAQDLLDGDISHRIRATTLDGGSVSALGTHHVEFRVTNSLGDLTELVLPVEVYLPGTYTAGLTLTDYLVYLPAGTSFNPKSYLNSFTLGAETTSLANGLPQNYSLRTAGKVDVNTPGVYSVSCYVTYTKVNESNSALNQTYTGYSKLIVVVEG